MTEKQRQFLKELIKNGGLVTYAARAVKIHRSTHHYWLKKDQVYKKLFEETLKTATEQVVDEVEEVLLKKAREGAQWAVTFYLKARGRRRGYHPTVEPDDIVYYNTGWKDVPYPEQKKMDESLEEESKILLEELEKEEVVYILPEQDPKILNETSIAHSETPLDSTG